MIKAFFQKRYNLAIFKYALREENAILFDHKTRRWARTTKKAKEGVELLMQ
jgi:hypothetical protein